MRLLRKLVVTATALSVLVTPVIGSAAYAIYLKNGRVYYTNAYWYSGSKIMFHMYDGIMGLDNNLVQEIQETDDRKLDAFMTMSHSINNNQDKEGPLAYREYSRAEEKRNKGTEDDEKNQAQQDENTTDLAYQQKKRELTQALDAALESFRHASAGQDAVAKKQALVDMTTFSQQIYALGDELKEKHGGVLPDWWEKE
jgi:hypothetical protein